MAGATFHFSLEDFGNILKHAIMGPFGLFYDINKNKQDTLNTSGVDAAGGGSQGGKTVTYTTPDGQTHTETVQDQIDIAREQRMLSEQKKGQYERQAATQILGMKTQEASAESGFINKVAHSGIKLAGSPLYQLASQQDYANKQIQQSIFETKSTAATIEKGIQIDWSAQKLQAWSIDMGSQFAIQDSFFTQAATALNFGTSLLGKMWSPGSVTGAPT